ncbi:hypothetical protein M501DRAFT_990436 [Patellaria atrata CBS 101060]|uniref:Uncharacterized protein n=1 Tax=Patellaria atrata CBS 101060 TaxID=1346257 RepID=A0A9P4S0X5_9PEZI|nr:hypothetical protein M501DRAFT_990436 [Patellaria atrata CBS 101060]
MALNLGTRPVLRILKYTRNISFNAQNKSQRALAKERISKPPQSLRVAAAERQKKEFPNDIGLFPETFIMPTGKNKPSIFQNPTERYHLELQRVKTRFVDKFSQFYYKFVLRRSKPRPSLQNWSLRRITLDLQSQMYLAFAAGDVARLREMCADGLYNSFRSRISQRSPSSQYEWRLESVSRLKTRVVSNKASPLPVGNDSKDPSRACGMRQVVVRIVSKQRLILRNPKESPQPGHDHDLAESKDKVKEVTEYLVLQRKMWMGVEEPWSIWGMAKETRWSDWLRDKEAFAERLTQHR